MENKLCEHIFTIESVTDQHQFELNELEHCSTQTTNSTSNDIFLHLFCLHECLWISQVFSVLIVHLALACAFELFSYFQSFEWYEFVRLELIHRSPLNCYFYGVSMIPAEIEQRTDDFHVIMFISILIRYFQEQFVEFNVMRQGYAENRMWSICRAFADI